MADHDLSHLAARFGTLVQDTDREMDKGVEIQKRILIIGIDEASEVGLKERDVLAAPDGFIKRQPHILRNIVKTQIRVDHSALIFFVQFEVRLVGVGGDDLP